jgi:pyroglutamyl-peptidase
MSTTAAHIILLTGFAPFRGRRANVSGDIARALDGLEIGGVAVRALVIDVAWGAPERAISRKLSEVQGQGQELLALLSLGEGGGDRIKVEGRARNQRAPGKKDETGRTPEEAGTQVFPGGPDEQTSLLAGDLRDILEAAGIPCVPSQSAGQFLCEEALYTGLRLVSPQRAGFLHIPPYPKGDRDASDPDNQAHLKSLESAVREVVKGLVNRKAELKESAV